ncbi:50S ribosomal protein L17 [Candidatus Tremblaya princeps]|uniref:50S ribosomal protein L17 n=1 Tax=Tremblaya princeps TaxID=189385 RepID=A0A143WPL7_TREPR|nr:50S ribosomal protein L17 [Candidatus Tremblaya princeps]
MNHRRTLPKLGRVGPHRLAMLRNLSRSLALHGRILTTMGRAKALRRIVGPAMAARACTWAQTDGAIGRASCARVIVRKAFRRRGDQAPMCSVVLA